MTDREMLTQLLEEVWDGGNGTGLDGWIGPGRGSEVIDDEAVYQRRRDVDNYTHRIEELFKPRLIETAEDALREPHGTYLRDSEGGLWEKNHGWLRCLNRGWNNPAKHGPFTVLWEGGE